ncbi:MAG: hypothetical protein GX444_10780 [Myxococcales bacterium]|nr:hypothetical protein [Myxococcales bacterium]
MNNYKELVKSYHQKQVFVLLPGFPGPTQVTLLFSGDDIVTVKIEEKDKKTILVSVHYSNIGIVNLA